MKTQPRRTLFVASTLAAFLAAAPAAWALPRINVLAGVGDGNLTDAAIAALEKAAKKVLSVLSFAHFRFAQ